MIRRSRITQEFDHTGSVAELLNVDSAIGEKFLLTKSGHVMVVLRVSGVDSECKDPEELQAVCRTFEAALRGLNEDFRVYQHFLKRKLRRMSLDEPVANSVVQAALSNRTQFLADKAGDMYETETYLTIVYEDEGHTPTFAERLRTFLIRPRGTSRSLLSDGSERAALETRIERACQLLSAKVDGLVVQLAGTIKTEVLSKHDTFRFFRKLLNYAPHKTEGVRLVQDAGLDHQIAGSTLECFSDHLRLDSYRVQVLSLKEPPSRTAPGLLADLVKVPAEFTATLEWKRVPNGPMRSLIQNKRRHFNFGRTSTLSGLVSSSGSPNALVNTGNVAVTDELGLALADLDTGKSHFGQFTMTLTVFAEDPARLRRAVAECHRTVAAHDGQFLDERTNALNAFLASVPGNTAYNLRALYVSNVNCADLSFLFAPESGSVRNSHLGAEYLAAFETREATPYFFNLHVGDVGHTLLLGSTGSGKSFLLNFFTLSAQKYSPRTFIFDIGGSYEHLTRLLGGSYVSVGLNETSLKINPFSLGPTPENLRFLFSFVRVLLECGGVVLSTSEEKDLAGQIENLYAVAPSERRLRTLAGVLTRRLRGELEKWLENGPYGGLFDNVDDTLTFAEFQAFDFAGMSQRPQVLEALLFYVFHRANVAVYDAASLTQLKLFIMDEAWRFFKHPTIKAYIVEALKTWRKKNACMILATQSFQDLLKTEMLEVAVESCPTQMFLASPGIDAATYREAFHLNATQAAAIQSLRPKQEILIKRPDGSKVVQLNVDRKGYWLYTSNPFEHQKREEAIERYGFPGALDVLAEEKS